MLENLLFYLIIMLLLKSTKLLYLFEMVWKLYFESLITLINGFIIAKHDYGESSYKLFMYYYK
jgi:hypothetical protein